MGWEGPCGAEIPAADTSRGEHHTANLGCRSLVDLGESPQDRWEVHLDHQAQIVDWEVETDNDKVVVETEVDADETAVLGLGGLENRMCSVHQAVGSAH